MKNKIQIYFDQINVQQKFEELLGKNSSSFITSVLQVVNSNALLQQATPSSVFSAAAIAATLNLPINPNLGFAYIVPYNSKKKDGTKETVAQFQIGYKGFIQLALRTGQFKTIAATPIFEGQIISQNPLTGYVFDFTKQVSKIIIGYAAYFELLNGFHKTLFMTVSELKTHGTRFSQSFKKGFGLWKDDFRSMALKTILKMLISKYAPLSVDFQYAIINDQAAISVTNPEPIYVDNQSTLIDKDKERIVKLIEGATSQDDLDVISAHVGPEQMNLFEKKTNEINLKTSKK